MASTSSGVLHTASGSATLSPPVAAAAGIVVASAGGSAALLVALSDTDSSAAAGSVLNEISKVNVSNSDKITITTTEFTIGAYRLYVCKCGLIQQLL